MLFFIHGNKQHNLAFKKPKAVTLLEMLISIFIFTLVSASVSLVFNRSLFVYRASTDKNIAAQEAQAAIEWLVRDIQTAYSIAIAQQDNIALINPQQQYIRYYLDADQTIKRQECADQSHLLAENVTQFSLKYYDINNNIIADPVTNILSLKTVEIDITTSRNRQEFRLYTVARFKYDPKRAWVKAYGGTSGDYLNSLQQTNDGYILGGETGSFGAGGYDHFLIKTDATGNLTWAKTHGGAGNDELRFLQQTSDGGYIETGYTYSFGAGISDGLLVKTDTAGNRTWAKTYGGTGMDQLYSLNQTNDGGYIASGYTNSFGIGGEDGFLIKTAATGNLTWAKTYGGAVNDYLRFLQQTSEGGYILGGYTSSFGAGGSDFLLLKTDAAGNLTWARTYGGVGDDELYSSTLQQTSDGGYIAGGYTYSFGAGGDFLLIKTDVAGNLTWAKTYGGAGEDKMRSLQQTGDGYILAGTTDSFGAGGRGGLLIKTDTAGNLTWAKAYGGTGNDYLLSLQWTSDGYIAGGYTYSFGAGGCDVFLVKTNDAGNLGCCTPLDVMEYSNDGDPANDDFIPITQSHGTEFTVTTQSHGTEFTVITQSHGTEFTVITQSHGTEFTLTTTPICPSP